MKEVTKDRFYKAFKKYNFTLLSSFTDMDGTSPFGYGCPATNTSYSEDDGDYPLGEITARKESCDDKKWEYKYYLKDTILDKQPMKALEEKIEDTLDKYTYHVVGIPEVAQEVKDIAIEFLVYSCKVEYALISNEELFDQFIKERYQTK